MAKLYWSAVLLFYFVWLFFSISRFSDIFWWSIFSSNRTTHTPYIEQVSLVKVTITGFVFGALYFLIRQLNWKRSRPE